MGGQVQAIPVIACEQAIQVINNAFTGMMKWGSLGFMSALFEL